MQSGSCKTTRRDPVARKTRKSAWRDSPPYPPCTTTSPHTCHWRRGTSAGRQRSRRQSPGRDLCSLSRRRRKQGIVSSLREQDRQKSARSWSLAKLTCVSVSGSWARLKRDTIAVVEVELLAVHVRSAFGGETNTVASASQFAGIAARADAGHFSERIVSLMYTRPVLGERDRLTDISEEWSGSRALFGRDAILSFRENNARFAGDGTAISILGAAQFASIAGCAGVVLCDGEKRLSASLRQVLRREDLPRLAQ
mgnify:FL=1